MNCRDAEQLLGHFVDAELPPPMLLAVARHAADCAACEQAARQLGTLHDAIARTVESDVAALDLSGVWSGVERRIAHTPVRAAWRARVASMPVWGGILAAAASALFFLRMQSSVPIQMAETKRKVDHAASRTVRNQTFIDRLDAGNRKVAVRREPKSGTTIIWVNYDPMGSPN